MYCCHELLLSGAIGPIEPIEAITIAVVKRMSFRDTCVKPYSVINKNHFN